MASTSKYPSFEESYDYVHRSQPHHSSHPSRPHDIAYEPLGPRKLRIPDFRFEQKYLKSIQQCIHIQPAAHEEKEREMDQHATAEEEDFEYASATRVSPLITPSQEVVRIDWGRLIFITVRDQVMVPLLQGMVWGVVGTYYKPVSAHAKTWLLVHLVPAPVREGRVAGWLRSWVKSIGSGSIAVGTPSLSIARPST